jgi:hypothetical protein
MYNKGAYERKAVLDIELLNKWIIIIFVLQNNY